MSSSSSLKVEINKRRSSIFARARQSFVRSRGQRGASVQTLRGNTGADFEGVGLIQRGSTGLSTGCFPFCKQGMRARNYLLLVKGPFCFVFDTDQSKSPRYAISLQGLSAKVSKASSGGSTVELTTSLGDNEYEISFDAPETAETFSSVVKKQAAVAETEQIRKRLGHGHLLNKRSSLRYAEDIAQKKVKDQPDAPASADDILKNMPDPSLLP